MTPPDLHEQYKRHVEERGDQAWSYIEWLENTLKDHQQNFQRQSLRPALVILPRDDHTRYLFFEDHETAIDVMMALKGIIHTVEVYRHGKKPTIQERLL